MKTIVLFFAIIFLPLWSYGEGHTSQTIRGTVVNAFMGIPLPGATVILVGSEPYSIQKPYTTGNPSPGKRGTPGQHSTCP